MSNGDGRGRKKAKLFLQVGSDGPACVMLQSISSFPDPLQHPWSQFIHSEDKHSKIGASFCALGKLSIKSSVSSSCSSWLCKRRVAPDLRGFLFFQKEVKGIQREVCFCGRDFPRVTVAMFGLFKN